jgi:dimeric dUTPase (all-alpha-NTP-PPase superfamily)
MFMRCLSTLRKTAEAIKSNKIQEDYADSVPDVVSVLKKMQLSDFPDVDIEGNIVCRL